MPTSVYLNTTSGALQVPALGVGSAPPSAGIAFPNATVLTDTALGTLAMVSSATTNGLRIPNGSNSEYSQVQWSSNTLQIGVVLNGGTNRNLRLTAGTGAAIIFQASGSDNWLINSSGHFVPNAATTYDIGTTTAPARSIYVGTGIGNVNATNGQALTLIQTLTELTTIAAAATTDTTIQMPAASVVLAVAVRVTTVIPTAATFTVGDSGSAARFSTTTVSTAATSTDPGTKAGAYYNASALSVRITPNSQPADNSGRVRVVIYYYTATPPTS